MLVMILVNPVPGKMSGQEVMVQGKQMSTVTELFTSKGVPKKWIEASDLTGKGK
jgi:translation initiation factor 2D